MLPAGRRAHAILALALAAGALAGLGAAAPPARGHASLLESTPRPGAQLADPPARIALVYTEPLNDKLTELRLVDAVSGRAVAATTGVTGGRRLELRPRERLRQGAYRLDWRSVSTIDGHIREGSVGFGVGTAALGSAVELRGSPLDGAGSARVAARWLFYAALFFFAGGLLNALLLARGRSVGAWLVPGDPRGRLAAAGLAAPRLADRAARRTVRAGWLAAGGSVVVVALEALDAGGLTGAPDFLFSGGAGASRLILVGALLGAAATARRYPAAAAALTATALLAIAQGGHAAGVEPVALAVVTDWVHLVAAAIWIGGITHVAWTWLPALRHGHKELRRAVLQAVLGRFGRVALPAFLIVAATGLVNALLQLGGVQELWRTGYGLVLAAKILLVGVVALLSYLHAFRLRPHLLDERPGTEPDPKTEQAHRRLLASEAPVGVAILAAAALLVGFPVPPRELREAEARDAVPACDPCPLARPAAGELAVAARVGRLTAAGWLRRRGGRVSGTLRLIDRERRPARVDASIAGARRQRGCGTGCWRFSVPRAGPSLKVAVGADGNRAVARLPAIWDTEGDRRARRIVTAAQRAMRELRTLRQVETVESTALPGRKARAEFRFEAPDRMAYETRASRSVVIGDRSWIRPDPELGWQEIAGGEEEFRVRDGFRWTVFASTARLIEIREQRDRKLAELALLDWGYPVWYRVTVDMRTKRALRQTLITPENLIEDRYFAFDERVKVRAPVAAGLSEPPGG